MIEMEGCIPRIDWFSHSTVYSDKYCLLNQTSGDVFLSTVIQQAEPESISDVFHDTSDCPKYSVINLIGYLSTVVDIRFC